ncbi:MAG: N-acetyl-gamma-glutamyl-phosphate reductase, partial [Candidatus Omnitrophica bacterium]|nr:N-acetyl-gamma-glutamyl-phosphate reductase [Candidatus Omnitrophota bacterium]
RHPAATVRYLASLRAEESKRLGAILPEFSRQTEMGVDPFRADEALAVCDLLFFCLPHGEAMQVVPDLLRKKKPVRVVDLSGDFRLKSAGLFARAYGRRHTNAGLLRAAAYGLTEWNRAQIQRSPIVANPGCYPTAALLALAPLAKERLLGEGVIVDAASGVTGAGRALKDDLLFTEVNEDFRAYKVNDHQHIPEMEQELAVMTRKMVGLTFVPHLAPLNRGLYATVYAPLRKKLTEGQVRSLYEKAYGGERFVRVLPEGTWPQVKSVLNTNDCEIGIRMEPSGRRLILLSAIDNLGKGAAGQAVQNMNRMFGLPEEAPWRSSKAG